MILLKQLKQNPILVVFIKIAIWFVSYLMFAVLKAERVSNDTFDKGYVFPDEDDDLTAYTGGTAEVMVPSGLLQDICK